MKASATMAAALLAASALASPGLAQVSDDVVKIGVLTDMTGSRPTSQAKVPLWPPRWQSRSSVGQFSANPSR
jgi:hypothetical protein